jgi:hypothetical protein
VMSMRKDPIAFSTIFVLWSTLLAACNLAQPVQPVNTALPAQTLTALPGGISEAYIDDLLAHSIEIVDPPRDWIVTGHAEDNHVIYPVDIGDINNMKIGMDDQRLYLELTMNGTFPAQGGSFPAFDGDQLHKFGLNVRVDTDNDPHTGVISDNGSEFMTAYGIAYENGQIHTNWISFSTEPTGTETPELARYKNTIFTDQTVFGGPGYDYSIIVLPLPPCGSAWVRR